jgi:hypothetical protein
MPRPRINRARLRNRAGRRVQPFGLALKAVCERPLAPRTGRQDRYGHREREAEMGCASRKMVAKARKPIPLSRPIEGLSSPAKRSAIVSSRQRRQAQNL